MITTLSTLRSNRIRKKKRLGRGNGSGRGNYSGRGIKGQKARSGGRGKGGHAGKKSPAFIRQLPKQRGFVSLKKKPATVNLDKIAEFFNEGEQITPEALRAKGLLSNLAGGVKILGSGQLTKKFTIKANAFSKSAKETILKAGGSVEIIKEVKSERKKQN